MPQEADAISPRQGKVASYAHARINAMVATNLYATFTWLGGGQHARE